MDADLVRSGLLASDMDAVADPPNEFATSGDSPSYTFPYYLPDGSRHPHMFRRRLHHPGPGQGKYTQPSKADIVAAGGQPWDATYPYLNPHVLALAGQSWAALSVVKGKRILLVEGEKKALSGMKYIGRPAIGIPGAYGALWKPEVIVPVAPAGASAAVQEKAARAAARARAQAARQPFQLHPVLAQIIKPGDTVDVVFDADVLTNPDVNRAAGTLRQVLRQLGAIVKFVLLPSIPNGPKIGLDDWIMGVQDKSLIAMLFDALERSDGEAFAADFNTLYRSLDLVLNAKDIPIMNLTNIRRIFDNHPDLCNHLWFDEVSNRLYETFTGAVRQVNDSSAIEITRWMQQKLGLHHFTHGLVREEMFATADNPKYTRNPVLDAISEVKWDGVPRLETMFIEAFGAEDTAYTRMVGRLWAVSAVARLKQPGCQVDTMLVLEGPQGIGKSKALEVLGGGAYKALQQKLDNKDFMVAAHTGWIVDMVELGAMKYADMEQVKGLVTTRTDTFRAPYGRVALDHARRFIMVGTTNTDDYLRDDTGNRRFWPMKCAHADIAWLEMHRLQLWAEALHQYMQGTAWWEDMDGPTAEATRDMQQSRMSDDVWQDILRTVLNNREPMHRITYCGEQRYFTAGVELLYALDVKVNDMPKYSRRLRSLMNRIPGWEPHHFQSKTQIITLRGVGGATNDVRGYLYTGPSPTALPNNVTPLPQATKF